MMNPRAIREMRSAGSVIVVVSGFLSVVVALAQGYVGIPLLRRPRRPRRTH